MGSGTRPAQTNIFFIFPDPDTKLHKTFRTKIFYISLALESGLIRPQNIISISPAAALLCTIVTLKHYNLLQNGLVLGSDP